MIKRVRDRIRQLRPQHVISYEEWTVIESKYIIASTFIKEDNMAYQILTEDLAEANRIVLENRVHEVREIRFISEMMQKVFVTSKEEQMNELVGQIKFIKGYLAELQSWIDEKIQLEHQEANGKIIIRRDKEAPIHEAA